MHAATGHLNRLSVCRSYVSCPDKGERHETPDAAIYRIAREQIDMDREAAFPAFTLPDVRAVTETMR
jgi:hypothetical protein